MIILTLILLLLRYLCVKSSNILQIFPSTYSQYFDSTSSQVEITLSKAFFLAEENQSIFGFSLWAKIIDPTKIGHIFAFLYRSENYYFKVMFTPQPSLSNLELIYEGSDNSPMVITFGPSNNWIFIAFSSSYELKSSIFYYHSLGEEIYISGNYLSEFPIDCDSVLRFGGSSGDSDWLRSRIGDIKFYNNIYNDAAGWNLVYLDSCAGVICANLYPSICYAECDQWCKSESEWFLPILQPTLNSFTPYLNILNSCYQANYDDIYFDINVPTNGWSDYSVTGWAQFPVCHPEATAFYQLKNKDIAILDISLIASSSSNFCDTLNAKIYNKDTSNSAFTSVSINSLSYIENWFFFAATVNSWSKALTLYIQNGVNPPSASFPLASVSITYSYVAMPLSPSIKIYIGGNPSSKIYPGNYADFRLYPGSHIDATLMHYSNNIYSAATYLDPNCAQWESIWYCKTCKSGYFIKNGLCQKCHPSCDSCSSDDTETNCLSCANGYYAQPGHPSMCFDYCPLGYAWDSFLNQCTGTKGTIAIINFDNNLSGDFISSNIYFEFGNNNNYNPDFDFTDPLPANKRGITLQTAQIFFAPQESYTVGRIFSSDWTIQLWILAKSNGVLYYSSLEKICISSFEISFEHLKFYMLDSDKEIITFNSPTLHIPFKNPEWALYSFSLSYNDFLKVSEILMARNMDYYVKTVSHYYKEMPKIRHEIGELASSIVGFVYSFAIYNYGKSYSEIRINLGTCNGCSACPDGLSYCLPTCDKTEYVDEDMKCQKCLSSCSKTCSRAGTCNLCYDELCHKCTKYDFGTCIQCAENADLKNGQCECKNGYINQHSKCVNKCEDGNYLDLKAQSCLSCPENCLKCNDWDSCDICKAGYIEKNGKCECDIGYFLDASKKCSKCNYSCLECFDNSSNCTSCISELPILYDSNKCYPCDSFEGYSNYFSIPITYFTDDLLFQMSFKCVEICGDGRNMGQSQCDDGNNINGDGCSSNCAVEIGWSCFGGSINSPDMCQDIIPPSPILSYLSEVGSGYALALSFSEEIIIHGEIFKNIKIDIDGITHFSWKISKSNFIYIIELELYQNVDNGTSVILNFIEPNLIADMHENKMKESSVKIILINSFTYSLERSIEASLSTVSVSAVAAAVIGSISSGFALGTFNLQALWGMIEMMQMQYYLIFLSVKSPDNLLSYLSALSISNGNFLPNPFQKYIVKKDPFSDPPERLLEEDYHTDFFMNAGQFLLVWVVILIGLPIILLLFRLFPKIAIIRWLKRHYLFSILLRLGIESFLEVTLSVFLQWREISEPNQNIGYLSLVLSFLTMIYLILTFFLIIWQITLKSEKDIIAKSHEIQFGTLYEGFKSNSKLTASFLIFQSLRRVLFVIFCVFLYDNAVIQVSLSTILSFLYTILLIILRPFKAKILGNALHISSEIAYLLAHCVIMKFLDDQLSSNDRVRLGWIIITLLSFSILLHLIAVFIVQTRSLITGIKYLKGKFMKSFANKFVKKRRNLKTIVLSESCLDNRHRKIDVDNENTEHSETQREFEESNKGRFKNAPQEDYFNIGTRGDDSFMDN